MNTALVGHMAELVDAPVSGTGGSNTLEVRVFLCPPRFAKGFVWHTICLCGCKATTGKRKFWGCSSVDRALRSHRRGRGFESHQLHQSSRGYGGMVDAEDLKSFGHCDRVGSSPTIPTKFLSLDV